jgi:hypothetical protein
MIANGQLGPAPVAVVFMPVASVAVVAIITAPSIPTSVAGVSSTTIGS